MYKAFRTRANYLTSYHLKSAAFWIVACGTASVLLKPEASTLVYFIPAIALLASTHVYAVGAGVALAAAAALVTGGALSTAACVALVAFSVPWALLATGILHNAAHGNFRPRWLCRTIGEVFGLLQLVGFPDWVVIHVIHHANPDDPEKDPHPPVGLSYWKFLLGMRASILKVLLKEYLGLWGPTPESKKQLTRLMYASKVEQVAKVTFCLLVFGPQVFAFLFAPSILLKMMHYAWFNWSTHVLGADGRIEIVNKTDSIYKVANVFSLGLYYHRNHHKNPKLFHPGRMRSGGPDDAAAVDLNAA